MRTVSQQLNYLPAQIQVKLNAPDFLQAVDDLIQTTNLPVYLIIAKLLLGEVSWETLPDFLTQQYGCDDDLATKVLEGLKRLGVPELRQALAQEIKVLEDYSAVQYLSETLLRLTHGQPDKLVSAFWHSAQIGDTEGVLAAVLLIIAGDLSFRLLSSPPALELIGASLFDDPLAFLLTQVLRENCHLSHPIILQHLEFLKSVNSRV